MTREEAIRTLKEHKIMFQHDFGWNISTIKALDMAISALSENKGEWIPIEEREPEVHKYVMFTTKTTRREIGYKAKEETYYFLFGDSGAYVKSDFILAWMELPEPYKKGE